jgi:nitroimidazol reductase NimA-like FMN-containing flavoprotein (pyridoxamine 5'-phosphate oxidase superfamily)
MWIDQRGSEILPVPECLRLLALAAKEDQVGRLAVADGQAILVVPLNFTYHDSGVLVRIGPGRLSELVPGSLVAFEVDRMEPEHGRAWSVLVHGLASTLDPGDSGRGAGAMPRPSVPEPGEEVLVIRVDVVTGRRFRLDGRDGSRADAASSAVPSM